MSTKQFLAHLHEAESRFICYQAGPKPRPDRIEVPVRHILGGPASAPRLAELREMLGSDAGQVEELYSQHDGLELYVQSPDHLGIELLPIDEWRSATKRFRKELKDWGRSLEEAFDFERHGVVFGEPAFSGNHFLLYQGAVYYSDHDGGDDDTPLAPTFSEFLERMVKDPAKFLYELGCYARYSDGRTDRQWIPERYLSRSSKS